MAARSCDPLDLLDPPQLSGSIFFSFLWIVLAGPSGPEIYRNEEVSILRLGTIPFQLFGNCSSLIASVTIVSSPTSYFRSL